MADGANLGLTPNIETAQPSLGGRPSIFSEEIADTICLALAEGMSLRTICSLDGMPSRTTVFQWLRDMPAFRTKYTQARDDQAETMVDECADIVDDGTNDFMERRNSRGELEIAYNGDSVQRSRLRVEHRRWYAERLLPKKYGTKQNVDVTGSVTLEHWVLESLAAPKNVTPAIEGEARVAGSSGDPEGEPEA